MEREATRLVLLAGEDMAEAAEMLAHVSGASYAAVVTKGAAEAREALSSPRPWRAVIVDSRLPGGAGLDVLAYARDLAIFCWALVLFDQVDDQEAARAFDLGAAYLPKPLTLRRIEKFLRALAQRIDAAAKAWARLYRLTDSEVDVLVRTAKEEPRMLIAMERGGSVRTVTKHVRNLLEKTKDCSLSEAAARLVREAICMG